MDIEASGSISCEGGSCDLEGALDSGCAAVPGKTTGEAEGTLLLGLFGVAYAAARRRRRKR